MPYDMHTSFVPFGIFSLGMRSRRTGILPFQSYNSIGACPVTTDWITVITVWRWVDVRTSRTISDLHQVHDDTYDMLP